jgi:hypothetical protein
VFYACVYRIHAHKTLFVHMLTLALHFALLKPESRSSVLYQKSFIQHRYLHSLISVFALNGSAEEGGISGGSCLYKLLSAMTIARVLRVTIRQPVSSYTRLYKTLVWTRFKITSVHIRDYDLTAIGLPPTTSAVFLMDYFDKM